MSSVIDEQTMLDHLHTAFDDVYNDSCEWFNELDRSLLGSSVVSASVLTSAYSYHRHILTNEVMDIHDSILAAELRDHASQCLIDSEDSSTAVIAELLFWWQNGDSVHQHLFNTAHRIGYVTGDIRVLMSCLEHEITSLQLVQ